MYMKKYMFLSLAFLIAFATITSCSLDSTNKILNQAPDTNSRVYIPSDWTGVKVYSGLSYTGTEVIYKATKQDGKIYLNVPDCRFYGSNPAFSYICINWPQGYKIRFYKNPNYITPGYFTTTIDLTGYEWIPDTTQFGGFGISSFKIVYRP